MVSTTFLFQGIVALASVTLASPYKMGPRALGPRVIVPQEHYEVLKMRSMNELNPNAILEVTCHDSKANIVFHEQNAAELNICGGIAGTVTKCHGNPQSTVGRSGTSQFELRAVDSDATITISKLHWEQCVRAARAVCPTGSMSATCAGGASSGNVAFTLRNA